MKVILLQHLSGAKTYAPDEEIEVSDNEALRMIEKGIAKAKTAKAHKDLMAKAEKIQKEESEKQAKIIAIQKGEELKDEAVELLDQLVAIVSTIGSIEPEYKTEFLGNFHQKFIGEGEENAKDNEGEGK